MRHCERFREVFRQAFRGFARSLRGSVAVETALGIVFLFSVAVLMVDMHAVGLERARLEAGCGQIAQNAAVQTKLTKEGLDVLVQTAMQDETRDTEVILMNVLQSGRIEWMLQRGDGALLCELEVEGGWFTGDLPVDPPENSEEEEDASDMSMVIVDVCRRTGGLLAKGGVRFPRVMQVESIYRANAREIRLDEALEDENLMPGDDDEDEAES